MFIIFKNKPSDVGDISTFSDEETKSYIKSFVENYTVVFSGRGRARTDSPLPEPKLK